MASKVQDSRRTGEQQGFLPNPMLFGVILRARWIATSRADRKEASEGSGPSHVGPKYGKACESKMYPKPNSRSGWLCVLLLSVTVFVAGQTPAKPAAQAPAKPATQTPTSKKPPAVNAPAAPQSKHYPILLIASGTEPFWSVRVGMKGAERLERAGYPPITLEPGEIASDDSGKAWTYKAKDTGTNADVTVQLSREACSDGMSETKYSFRAVVNHAQIGELKGCARIAAEQFPEFKQKNLDDDDPEKKKVVPPAITGFKPPVAVAFLDPTGKVMLARGEAAKVVAPGGSQLSLSHDGKRLVYTREEQGKDRTILLYDAATGKTTELMRGQVQSGFWSPDDTKIAYLKMSGQNWTVWAMPSGSPDSATQLGTNNVWALHGWLDAQTVLASDSLELYLVRTEGPATSIPLSEVYGLGGGFQVMASDTIRANPVNPDLLLVTAVNSNIQAGQLTLPKTAPGNAGFLYEIAAKRRVVVTPPNVLAQDAEWSRDGIQIFFTSREGAKSSICRIFWDGSGFKRQRAGSFMVVGQ
jgi:uncharacterized membrane protein